LLEEALELYVKVLDDESFVSKKGNKSRYQLWMELCEFIAKSPLRSQHLTTSEGGPEYLIRHALSRYTDEVGRLWIFLADYFLRQGLFGRARDVFEEALSSVTTARDFGIVFNAYMKFEEQMIEAEIEEEAEQEEDEGVEDQIDRLLQFTFREVPERQAEVE
jgi:pre-mRNA-splicing factor SYF1